MLNPKTLPNMVATPNPHLMNPMVGISQKYKSFATMDVIQYLDFKFLPQGFYTHVLWIQGATLDCSWC